MKILILLLLITSPLWAEDWTVNGQVYRNVVISGQTGKTISVTYNGGVGQFDLCDLPPEIQKRFGYDPSQTKTDLDAEKQRKQDEIKAESQQKLAAEKAEQAQEIKQEESKIADDIDKSKTEIRGSVLQKTEDGLLLSLDVMMSTENGAMYVPYDYNPVGARKVILLQDSDQEKEAVDNDRIFVSAYPMGTYSYNATDGSNVTVKRFTTDPSKALAYWVARANAEAANSK